MRGSWCSVGALAVEKDPIYRWIGQRVLPSNQLGGLWRFIFSGTDDVAHLGGFLPNVLAVLLDEPRWEAP